MMNFVGPGTRLSSADVARAALELGCETSVLLAIMQAESNVRGFYSKFRPKILFEQYVFYRKVPPSLKARAVKAGLAVTNSEEVTYAHTSDANYSRLAEAMELDEASALEACSWGIGQVLGANYQSLGFASSRAMALSAINGEQDQLAMMVDFLKVNNLSPYLRAKDWEAVARVYNGPDYKKYRYDDKLASYYRAWKSQGNIIPYQPLEDTAPNDAHRVPVVLASQKSSKPTNSGVSSMLALAGYKTYIVAALTVLYAVIGVLLHYVTDNAAYGITWQSGINLVIAALFGTTFRSAMKTQTGGLGSILATVGEQISTALGNTAPTQAAAAMPKPLHADDISAIVDRLLAKADSSARGATGMR